jgi:hypothetical protein
VGADGKFTMIGSSPPNGAFDTGFKPEVTVANPLLFMSSAGIKPMPINRSPPKPAKLISSITLLQQSRISNGLGSATLEGMNGTLGTTVLTVLSDIHDDE